MGAGNQEQNVSESGREDSTVQTDELNILLGTRVVVDIEGIGERLESRLVGSDGKGFLLLTTPEFDSSDQVRDQYYLGRQVVGRFLASGRVHGFRSQVKQALSRPSRLLFLSFPSAIEKVDLRSSRRFAALCSALLQGKSEKHAGVLIDISKGGCCLRVRLPDDSALRRDEAPPPVTLHLPLPSAKQPLALQGQVRDCKDGGRGIFELGICFAQMSPQNQQELGQYLDLLEEAL